MFDVFYVASDKKNLRERHSVQKGNYPRYLKSNDRIAEMIPVREMFVDISCISATGITYH